MAALTPEEQAAKSEGGRSTLAPRTRRQREAARPIADTPPLDAYRSVIARLLVLGEQADPASDVDRWEPVLDSDRPGYPDAPCWVPINYLGERMDALGVDWVDGLAEVERVPCVPMTPAELAVLREVYAAHT